MKFCEILRGVSIEILLYCKSLKASDNKVKKKKNINLKIESHEKTHNSSYLSCETSRMMDTTTSATLTTTTDTINMMFISSIPPLSSFVVELGLPGDGCDRVVVGSSHL